jgi:hypothetical protein
MTEKTGNELLLDNLDVFGAAIAQLQDRLKKLEARVESIKVDIDANTFNINTMYDELMIKEESND